MAWLCTTIAGSRPILFASCRAAPSAFGPAGTGRVNEVCTMPSPVVSPYGRTMLPTVPPPEGPKSRLWPRSGMGGLPGLEQLQRRVVGVAVELDHAVQTLAAVDRPPGDAEGAVGDRIQQATGMVGDPFEQVDGLPQHGVGSTVDEA